jgi:prepilin-type processing-associated H-X9-DG protein
MMYANDFDETLPQTFSNIDGVWLRNYWFLVPATWSSMSSHPAVVGSQFVWPNTCKVYGIDDTELKCPSQRSERLALSRFTYDSPKAMPIVVSYSLNGYLNSYKLDSINNKALVPMVWESRGRNNGLGGVLPGSTLACDDGTQPCVYNTSCNSSINGGTGSLFGIESVWTHRKQNYWLFVDGHVEKRNLGAVLSPQRTDHNIDPYVFYDESGKPSSHWTNGCHAWLFRPNR